MNLSCRIPLAIMLALAGFALAMVVKAVSAKAHQDGGMIYPPECCHNLDCAPVEKVEIISGSALASMLAPPAVATPSAMVVTTKHGTVIVPANFPRRESKDSRMHACMRPGPTGAMRLICIFLPPGN